MGSDVTTHPESNLLLVGSQVKIIILQINFVSFGGPHWKLKFEAKSISLTLLIVLLLLITTTATRTNS